MKQIYQKIWKLAKPYLKKGIRKDFVLHTKGVIRAMEYLIVEENGEEDILLPAAILHDVGWAKVPKNLQRSDNQEDQIEALKLHIKFAPEIIRETLEEVGYETPKIERIIDIVKSHKFQDPQDLSKQLLIDADTLSDAFKEQFFSNVESYNTSPKKHYEFRKANQFYTKSARILFNKELEERRREFENIK